MSAARARGTAAETKLCAHCETEPTPTNRHSYCVSCAGEVRRLRTRQKDDARLKGCLKCKGPNPGRGSRYCADCRVAMLPAWQQAERERGRRKQWTKSRTEGKPERHLYKPGSGIKWCPRCQQEKPIDRFSTNRGRGHGLSSYCIPCMSEIMFERRLARQFNITSEDYSRLLAIQDGRCAICRSIPRKRRLAVDHDHETGAIRGLLCTRCNHDLLGACRDKVEILERAICYLESPPAITGVAVVIHEEVQW